MSINAILNMVPLKSGILIAAMAKDSHSDIPSPSHVRLTMWTWHAPYWRLASKYFLRPDPKRLYIILLLEPLKSSEAA